MARSGALSAYHEKRDFARTKEPRGRAHRSAATKLAFVIQKHDASHLHFDLRLEVDGAMKSWAVPKGPSRDPATKRLAMAVEDHPIEYNDFEGTIPKGQYGGGTVMIWDRGSYESPDGGIDAIRAGLSKGRLNFTLHGERLHGTWSLVQMRSKGDRSWLLVKKQDEFAEKDDDLAAQDVESVVSGRRMSAIAEGKSAKVGKKKAAAKRARKSDAAVQSDTPVLPDLQPMLASVGTTLPTGKDWAFEPKYDGVRVLAFAGDDGVVLLSRNGIDKAQQFPEIVDSLKALSKKRKRPFVIDGEIVARDGKKLGRFQALQGRIGQTNATIIKHHRTAAPVVLVAFDVLVDGVLVLTSKPWTTRRTHLERLVGEDGADAVQLGEANLGGGERLLARATKLGWEGIMAKRVDASYAPGVRSRDWLKLKIEGRQEFVVGGWTEPRNSRQHLGALLIGYWDGDKLRYAGHVGGGFTQQCLREMHKQLEPLERKTSPFADDIDTNERAHWATPRVVVEIKFNEWTADGRLRQPVYVGMRDDKDPKSVTREQASADPPPRKRARAKTSNARTTSVAEQLTAIEEDNGKGIVRIGRGASLAVSNLQKVFFPALGRTKGDLMRYYESVSEALLPMLADRPLVLKRYPDGVEKPPFFQQNAADDTPPDVRVETVPADAGPSRRIVGGDLTTLLYCVQLGSIDMNPWHSRVGALQYVDYTILDLDPGPAATFATVIRVAKEVKAALDASGIHGSLKTSGSRGLHIAIPLPLRTNEKTAQLVAQFFAQFIADTNPDVATTVRARASRPPKTVYVDYLQNIVGKSIASALSVRARPEATVSAPLEWDELTPTLKPARFTMDSDAAELLARGKSWNAAMKVRNSLKGIAKDDG